MPPLRLQPLFKQRPWGGQRLAQLWHKPNTNTTGWAESWEVVDLGEDQSQVLGGPFDGRSLHDLVREHPHELLGRHAACQQFPLLFKFLDAAETLSVQVHPNDAQAATLAPGQHGKSEAWLILAAESNSQLSVGLKPGVDRTALEGHLAAGTVEQCLHTIPACVGDVISVPAGTVHAIGTGVALAEIQQSSDVTFRLFDWNRRDAQDRSRPLHIDQALQCIDFSLGPVFPLAPRQVAAETLQACDLIDSQASKDVFTPPCSTAGPDTGELTPPRSPIELGNLSEELIQTEYFVWRRHRLTGIRFRLPEEDRCRILSLIKGDGQIVSPFGREPLVAGRSLVIPAACSPVEIEARAGAVLLETLPR